jgi:predicted phosphate transport protein (TIGR00153 family)
MKFHQLLRIVLPRHDNFFHLFEEDVKNLQEAGRAVLEAVRLPFNHERAERVARIEALEHRGDEITHKIYQELGASFVSPFDREDIHFLASALDDVLDYIQGTGKRMTLYEIESLPQEGVALADTLKRAIDELATVMPLLRDMANKDHILNACVRINSLENQADDAFDHAIATLFKKSKDPIQLIKIKEILVGLETASDKCEDAANALESIILKNT